MGRLSNKVAVITGASSGIGRACFNLFSAEGARVVGTSRTKSHLDDALDEILEADGKGFVVAADIGDSGAMDNVIAATIERYGRVDILVHAAGVGYALKDVLPGSMGATNGLSDGNWREVMRVDLDACFYAARAILPHMIEQGSGSIVNVASIFGLGGTADAHAYSSAKAAVVNFTRSLCIAYAKDGIRANSLCPGFVDTPMIASMIHHFGDESTATQLSPMGRAGRPIEIANGCLFLASDEASYCNGSTLVIDGGTTANV